MVSSGFSICLYIEQQHLCWCFSPRSRKSLLSYCSGRSKIGKNGIAYNYLNSARTKSCHRKISFSFRDQLDRLKKAGFPDSSLSSVSFRLLKSLKLCTSRPEQHTSPIATKPKHIPVIRYVLTCLSHQLKEKASGYHVNVVFLARGKIGMVCATIEKKKSDQSKKHVCFVSHRDLFFF